MTGCDGILQSRGCLVHYRGWIVLRWEMERNQSEARNHYLNRLFAQAADYKTLRLDPDHGHISNLDHVAVLERLSQNFPKAYNEERSVWRSTRLQPSADFI